MSEIISTLYTTSYYTFSSPRYNTLYNYPTQLVPEDYSIFDAVNGTCDKYFPCYVLTSCDKPKTELVKNTGEAIENKGCFSFREHIQKAATKKVGKKDKPASPSNDLAQYKIQSDLYTTVRLNAGWSVIQTKNIYENNQPVEYLPQFVVRALGNNTSIRELYVEDLDTEKVKNINSSTTNFLSGELVVYKKNIYKCIKDTLNYPPVTAGSDTEEWKYINFSNVFNADIFALTDTSSAYFTEVSDEERLFDPDKEDDTLICWSVAYYHQ